VLPIEPTTKALKRLHALSFWSGGIVRLLLRRLIPKVEIVGREHLSGGNRLVLMNHSTQLDPLLISFFGREAIQFLVTEPFMAERRIAKFTAWLGQIPKRKLDTDTRSIRTMKQWCQVGGTAGMFPEGQFSWDGYPLPLQPGLAQLVNYLDVPVVTVRLINGDRLWPAWAKYPRKTSLRFEIDPPKKFAPGESIEDYVAERLHVNPDTCVRFEVTGKKLAEGLAQFLRFCFACGSDSSLTDAGDELKCGHCYKTWQVSAENTLRDLASGEIQPIAEVWARIQSQLKTGWKEKMHLDGFGEVRVFDASRPQWVTLQTGDLKLEGNLLTVKDWSFDLKELLTHTMDWGNLILLRTHRKRVAIQMPKDSRAVWTVALNEVVERLKNGV
jgi:1-acyl-sn-glycerol-3-phosphate acyltransferase/ribosomal protein S27AE